MPRIGALIMIGMLATAPGPVAARSIGCPGIVARVELERGHDNPPSTLAPDVDRRGGRYQEWRGLRAPTANDRVTLTCYGPGKKVERIALPDQTDRCIWRSGRLTCG